MRAASPPTSAARAAARAASAASTEAQAAVTPCAAASRETRTSGRRTTVSIVACPRSRATQPASHSPAAPDRHGPSPKTRDQRGRNSQVSSAFFDRSRADDVDERRPARDLREHHLHPHRLPRRETSWCPALFFAAPIWTVILPGPPVHVAVTNSRPRRVQRAVVFAASIGGCTVAQRRPEGVGPDVPGAVRERRPNTVPLTWLFACRSGPVHANGAADHAVLARGRACGCRRSARPARPCVSAVDLLVCVTVRFGPRAVGSFGRDRVLEHLAGVGRVVEVDRHDRRRDVEDPHREAQVAGRRRGRQRARRRPSGSSAVPGLATNDTTAARRTGARVPVAGDDVGRAGPAPTRLKRAGGRAPRTPRAPTANVLPPVSIVTSVVLGKRRADGVLRDLVPDRALRVPVGARRRRPRRRLGRSSSKTVCRPDPARPVEEAADRVRRRNGVDGQQLRIDRRRRRPARPAGEHRS